MLLELAGDHTSRPERNDESDGDNANASASADVVVVDNDIEKELDLPVDFHRTRHTQSQLESYAFELSLPSLGDGDVAPHLLLTAVFGILLARWTGQPSIVIRTSRWPLARTASATHDLSPLLTLRLQTPFDTTCRNILSQLEPLIGLSNGFGSKSNSHSNSNSNSHSNSNSNSNSNSTLSANPNPIELIAGSDANADAAELHLVAVRSRAGFRATFVYDTALFRARSIQRFANHLQTLLTGAAIALDAPIARLPLLDRNERRDLEAICTGRPSEPSVLSNEVPVHERIERVAATAPHATALRYRDRSITYEELNRRANRLARYLIAKGVGPESPVIVCVEPAFEILIALLAILKAGAIYVPLDPGYPAKRIRAIVDDIRPALIITQGHLVSRLSLSLSDDNDADVDTSANGNRNLVLPLDTAMAEGRFADFSEQDLNLPLEPTRTAYVYYTSGTTGTPKGVMASHANLTSYVRTARERYGFCESDIVPAIARFSFSISMFELITPLSVGGTLVILDRDHVLDPIRMSKTLTEVTLFHAGPSLLKSVLPYIRQHYSGDYASFARVRHASSGGDMVPPHVIEGLKEIFTNAEVFVIYGCSEISCMGTTWPVSRGSSDQRVIDKTFVGRPFDDVTVVVMDHAQNLLPVGVVGEVLFAGPGLVKGYLNRPELTKEKFVIINGRRFYRTGDMGRISESGWLELVGRTDFRIKIRGMRIELAEVEHHLRTAPGVRDGVVVARANEGERRGVGVGGGEKMLVAYVVFDAASSSAESEIDTGSGARAARKSRIRHHMADHLPDYMVPAIYVELASLPLNHNMKVDRRALPDVPSADLRKSTDNGNGSGNGHSSGGGTKHENKRSDAANADTHDEDDDKRTPETPNERLLAKLWKDLLIDVNEVSIDDNFFELGGDSLLGLQLLMAVELELGVTLDGMDVLRESLEVLARICDTRLGKPPSSRRRLRSRSLATTTTATANTKTDAFELLHFGPDRSLYGVLHHARTDGRSSSSSSSSGAAVLICSPIGQEHLRTHFVLKQLAEQLAVRGVSVLRFDYYGCGNSLGESHDAGCMRWQRDVACAYRELRQRTGAARITALGVRLGAALLWNVLSRCDRDRNLGVGLDLDSGFERLVFWDPICDGSAYIADLIEHHRRYLRATEHGWWWQLIQPSRRSVFTRALLQPSRRTELLGSSYSATMLRELESLRVASPDALVRSAIPAVKWLATSPPKEQLGHFHKLICGQGVDDDDRRRNRIETLPIECAWRDAAQLKSIIPDAGITAALATMVLEPLP